MPSTVVSVLILTAAVLFAREVSTIDIITLLMLLALIATATVTPAVARRGFVAMAVGWSRRPS
ncbi:MAG: hypothetical protein ABIP94_02355 [Planctomycetota bacterium]